VPIDCRRNREKDIALMTRKASRAAATATKVKARPKKSVAAKLDPQAIAPKVLRRLKADYPDATCALGHESAFELLISTILSAQCTDQRVNMVTPELFGRWPTPADLARAPIEQIEKVIQSTGFFRNKAKNIKGCSQALCEKHDGVVPQEIEQLVELPGVGRKTANVVLGTVYGLATGVVVDTHVTRLSNRLGLTTHSDATKIELDLMQLLPKREWVDFAHRMIEHGRQVCSARKPKCDQCSMNSFCRKIGVA
jgi:endonuclease-3